MKIKEEVCREGYTNMSAITAFIHVAKSSAGWGPLHGHRDKLPLRWRASGSPSLWPNQSPSSSLIAVSSLSYLGSLLWPTPPTVHDHLKRTAPVLRAPVSFHPVTLCRANHSLNVLTVKLLLSLLFSTKFSHNNPPVIFFTNKIYE